MLNDHSPKQQDPDAQESNVGVGRPRDAQLLSLRSLRVPVERCRRRGEDEDNKCPWDSNTCAYAAMNGHFDVLRWARDYDCPWDVDTCTFAAMNGHLEVIKWLHENWSDNFTTYGMHN